MSCGAVCRRCSDLTLLWLWHRVVATAPIQPLAWELSHAAGSALKKQTNKKICLFQSSDFYFVQEYSNHWIVCFFIGIFSKSTLLYKIKEYPMWVDFNKKKKISMSPSYQVLKFCPQYTVCISQNIITTLTINLKISLALLQWSLFLTHVLFQCR